MASPVARRPMQPTEPPGPERAPQVDPQSMMASAGNGTGRGPISPMNIGQLMGTKQDAGLDMGNGAAQGPGDGDPMGGDFSMILRLLQGMGRV